MNENRMLIQLQKRGFMVRLGANSYIDPDAGRYHAAPGFYARIEKPTKYGAKLHIIAYGHTAIDALQNLAELWETTSRERSG